MERVWHRIMIKFVITGAGGLLGWHAASHLHAANCAAQYKGCDIPYNIVLLDHADFDDDVILAAALERADAILHFAGVNRAPGVVLENANPNIARRLVAACELANVRPHIVYANSTHAAYDTPYGRSKRIAGEILATAGGRYSDLLLPHIFGECAKPRYNNVTATFIEAVIAGETPQIDPDGAVSLLHAGAAVQAAIVAVLENGQGVLQPEARHIPVPELFEILQTFHANYTNNIYPDLSDSFTVALFNSYRSALYPSGFPQNLKVNADARGVLFEAVKGGGGGQTFFSTTKQGITRGNHFHLSKVERFLVIKGQAIIRIRKVLSSDVIEYHVSGDTPTPVDMPTLYTHSIENVGLEPLMTLFWTHDMFDPEAPDTYFDTVLKD